MRQTRVASRLTRRSHGFAVVSASDHHVGTLFACHLQSGRILIEQEERRVIEVGLLGSIVVQVDDNRVELAGVLEKALLARLSVNPGSTVSQSRLIDDLWGESPPTNAVGSLQTLVYRLRKALGPAGSAISRADNGYRLDTPAERVDAAKFEPAGGARPPGALTAQPNRRTLLTEALGLWRGPAFEGLDSVPFVAARRAGLEAARMSALGGADRGRPQCRRRWRARGRTRRPGDGTSFQ